MRTTPTLCVTREFLNIGFDNLVEGSATDVRERNILQIITGGEKCQKRPDIFNRTQRRAPSTSKHFTTTALRRQRDGGGGGGGDGWREL